MINKILVFIEQRNGQIKKSSLETASAAINIADAEVVTKSFTSFWEDFESVF